MIVDVGLDRQTDDPQLIFESLNSTGVDLSQSDLIRNFILMRLPEKEQTQLYETYWSKIEVLFRGSEWTFDAFARDYVAFKTEATKQEKADQIYYAFRDFFPGLKAETGGLEEALDDMLRHARYYAAFSLGRGVTGERARHLASLRRLVDVPAILVMRLFECRNHADTLSEEEFLSALALMKATCLGARSATIRREDTGRFSLLLPTGPERTPLERPEGRAWAAARKLPVSLQ